MYAPRFICDAQVSDESECDGLIYILTCLVSCIRVCVCVCDYASHYARLSLTHARAPRSRGVLCQSQRTREVFRSYLTTVSTGHTRDETACRQRVARAGAERVDELSHECMRARVA